MLRTVTGALCATLLMAGCGATTHKRETLAGLLGINTVGRFRAPSGSMEPTLRPGEHFEAHPGRPAVGAVVVFHPPQGAVEQECGPRPHVVKPGGAACAAPVPREEPETDFVKRIVAGPGDRLYLRRGHVHRQAGGRGPFVRESDFYIRPCAAGAPCDFPLPITVPAGDWYLLGDNRGESDDSRFWGPVPAAWLVGLVVLPHS